MGNAPVWLVYIICFMSHTCEYGSHSCLACCWWEVSFLGFLTIFPVIIDEYVLWTFLLTKESVYWWLFPLTAAMLKRSPFELLSAMLVLLGTLPPHGNMQQFGCCWSIQKHCWCSLVWLWALSFCCVLLMSHAIIHFSYFSTLLGLEIWMFVLLLCPHHKLLLSLEWTWWCSLHSQTCLCLVGNEGIFR